MLLLKRHALAATLIVLLLGNATLCALAFLTRADPAGERGTELKVVAFNKEYSNQDIDRLVSFLREAKPDIVLVEEILPQQAATLFDRLKLDFPSQVSCPPGSGCILGLLAKAPMLSSGHQGRTEDVPPQVWAEFSRPGGPPLRVVGVHLAFPLTAYRQVRHIDALVQQNSGGRQPVVIAGDFNLTPWSWLLNKLAWKGGLRRHGLLEDSWPSDWGSWVSPFLLPDNVITSADIKSRSFAVGPDLGSDHRPIIATLVVP